MFTRKRLSGAARAREYPRSGLRPSEQQSQAAFSLEILRTAGLLPASGVGSALTARCGDAWASPPWLQPKSLAAASMLILQQAPRALDATPHPPSDRPPLSRQPCPISRRTPNEVSSIKDGLKSEVFPRLARFEGQAKKKRPVQLLEGQGNSFPNQPTTT